MNRLRRRPFVRRAVSLGASTTGLILLGGCGLALRATPGRSTARVGALVGGSLTSSPVVDAFVPELSTLLRAEGRDYVLEQRFGQGDLHLLGQQAAELAALKLDVLLTIGSAATNAARRALSALPIVFTSVGDPVLGGYVSSYAHPGGNLTGVTQPATLNPKRLELLKEAVPCITRVAYLWWDNATTAQTEAWQQTQAAARPLGIVLTAQPLYAADDLDGALQAIVEAGMEAIYVAGDQLTDQLSDKIVSFCLRVGLPAGGVAAFARAGGLTGYSADQSEVGRLAARLVDKILSGANPADLPIQQMTAFETVFNLKTAQALGLKIPPAVVPLVTEWIQ